MITDRPKYSEYTQDNMDDISLSQYRYIQPKYDGIWGRMVIQDGEYAIFSRNGKLKKHGVYKGKDKGIHYEVIGEYINNKNHPVHTNQAFYAFDCIVYRGSNVSKEIYGARQGYVSYIAEYVIPTLKDRYLSQYFRVSPTYDMAHTTHNVEDLWEYYVEMSGFEGLVFKQNEAYDYPQANIRVKQRVEIEYMCIGFDMADPESKYAGQVGAVRGSLFDKPCDVKCGGLTEAMRREFTDNPDKYIGQVFTAKGNGWFPSGSVRHPKFYSWRDDKTMTECLYSQIPESIRAS